jgi:hypothetical protein
MYFTKFNFYSTYQEMAKSKLRNFKTDGIYKWEVAVTGQLRAEALELIPTSIEK